MINPTTDAITEFAIPTTNSGPQDITAGPDGNLWFTENAANEVGMINPTTDKITEFAIPTRKSGPWGISSGPDGNLWFTEDGANKIGEINPKTHAITEFPIPAGSEPYEITEGPNGNLWFGVWGFIAEINPTTHVITQFATPSGNGAMGITAGPDGDIWFTEAYSSIRKISIESTRRPAPLPSTPLWPPFSKPWRSQRAQTATSGSPSRARDTSASPLSTSSQLVVTQQPPASITAGSAFGLTVQAEDSSGNLLSFFNGTVTVGLANNSSAAPPWAAR